MELRRIRPNVEVNDLIIMYVSSPTKELKAFLKVDQVLIDKPDNLWKKIGEESGLSREEYNQYFEGANTGYAIRLKDIDKIPTPISLQELRELIPGFNPPQSYRYFSGNDLNLILSSAQTKITYQTLPFRIIPNS
ncbi:MAG: hypothetical protein JXB38_02145 [Anaerolineales bacterium]|nr:hypothetical protein [Anaerolineales bacterium]